MQENTTHTKLKMQLAHEYPWFLATTVCFVWWIIGFQEHEMFKFKSWSFIWRTKYLSERHFVNFWMISTVLLSNVKSCHVSKPLRAVESEPCRQWMRRWPWCWTFSCMRDSLCVCVCVSMCLCLSILNTCVCDLSVYCLYIESQHLSFTDLVLESVWLCGFH